MNIKIAFACILIMSLAPIQLTAGPPGAKGGFGDIGFDDIEKSAKKEGIKPKQRSQKTKPSNKNSNSSSSKSRAKKPKVGYRSIWDPVAY